MKRISKTWIFILGVFVLFGENKAAGISVDAGLTPAEGRWIVRAQSRQMSASAQAGTPIREMNSQAAVLMTAYGLRSNITLIGMQGWMNREMNMMGTVNNSSGFMDLNLLVKYLIHRSNTRSKTLGLSATAKLTLPTGESTFSDEYWSITPGMYLSFRHGTWGVDASTTIQVRDLFSSQPDIEKGWAYSLDGAVARQLPIGTNKNMALAPVIELSLNVNKPDYFSTIEMPEPESVLYLSPGFKATYASFILESLIQVPIWEDIPLSSLKNDIRWRLGLRFMF